MRAESIYGRGSRFTVSIPLGRAHLPPEHVGTSPKQSSVTGGASAYVEEALHWLPDASSATTVMEGVSPFSEIIVESNDRPVRKPPRRSSARILLADDNADMRHYVQRLLTGSYEVYAVRDGEAALAVARENPPELVLADIMMPRLDGFGLLQALRTDPRTRSIPVILLSARAGEESQVEGLEAGANDYLIKPFSARELLARVGARLEMARMNREALEREHELRKSAEEAEKKKYGK